MFIRLNLFVRMSCQPCLIACHATSQTRSSMKIFFYVTYLRVVELMCLLQAELKRNVRTVMFLISTAPTCRCTGKLITIALFSHGGSRLRINAFYNIKILMFF